MKPYRSGHTNTHLVWLKSIETGPSKSEITCVHGNAAHEMILSGESLYKYGKRDNELKVDSFLTKCFCRNTELCKYYTIHTHQI